MNRLHHVSGTGASSPVNLAVTSTSSGSLLVAACVWQTGAGTLAVTDNKSGGTQTYLNVIGPIVNSSNSAQMAYVQNSAAGVTQLTFTINGSAPTLLDVYMVEYSGIKSSGALDKTISGTGFGSAGDSGFFATNTAQAANLLVGFAVDPSGSSITAGNDGRGDNYTKFDSAGAVGSALMDFFPTTAVNTYKATASFVSTPNWILLCASFEIAPAHFLSCLGAGA